MWVVRNGEVRTATIDPQTLGITVSPAESLRGGDASHNADVVREVMDGASGPVRDAVLLNAAAALAVYQTPELDPPEAMQAGLDRAREAIDSGAARATLDRWVAASLA